MKTPPTPLDPWFTRFATAFTRAHTDSLIRFCDRSGVCRAGLDLGIRTLHLESQHRFDREISSSGQSLGGFFRQRRRGVVRSCGGLRNHGFVLLWQQVHGVTLRLWKLFD
jgi:hypothetical protein